MVPSRDPPGTNRQSTIWALARRALAIVPLVGLLVSCGGLPPVALQATLPTAPDPRECGHEPPRVAALLARLGATPLPRPTPPPTRVLGAYPPPAPPPAMTPPFSLPTGTAVDQATLTELVATARAIVACHNTGRGLIDVPFYTDGCFRRRQVAEPLTAESVMFYRSREGDVSTRPADFWSILLGVRGGAAARGRPDRDAHRYAAVRRYGGGAGTEPDVDYVYFLRHPDGRWLVDGVVEDLELQYPPPPAPGLKMRPPGEGFGAGIILRRCPPA